MKQTYLKTIHVVLGTLSLIVGILFLFLPVLPTIPFLAFAAYCFSKVSARFHGRLAAVKNFLRRLAHILLQHSNCKKKGAIMTQSTSIKRIIWAVDAFQESPEADEIHSRCVDALKTLVRGRKVAVQPVYVVPPQRVNTPFELLYPPLGYYGGEAESELNKKLRNIRIAGLLPPKIIDKPLLTTTASIKALSEYAVETNADLIVVGTHGRKGVSRLFLGSFAESLLLHSSVPIFTVGRATAPIKSFGRILFPTDFGNTSEAVFPRVVDLASSFQATLFIYHMVVEPIVLPSGFASVLDMAAFTESERHRCAELVAPYLKIASLGGVMAKFKYEISAKSESDAILAAAKQNNVDLIAMAAQRGAAASIFAGSTTRQVARSASYPVWILHARPLAKSINRRAA